MKIVLLDDNAHASPYIEAFGRGLTRHGQDFSRQVGGAPPDADLVVFWGHRKLMVINKQRAAGHDYLVMERGYVGARFEYTSLGFNGLNGRADFLNDTVPDDRLYLFINLMRRWRGLKGRYWAIMGQVAGDASLAGCDIYNWYQDIIADIKGRSTQPIVFRPHPLSRQYSSPMGSSLRTGRLSDILADAKAVITYNSNSGVDAILAGVPTMAQDRGSMAYAVACHKFEDLADTGEPDRKTWLQRLSYCQWSSAEIADGIAWQHLKRRYA